MSVTDDEVSGYDHDVVSLYPLLPLTRDEAVKVVAFGLHRPAPVINEDIRGGFLILGILVAGLTVVAFACVGLYQLVHG